MKIGIIQSPVTNDKETNLANAEESIRQAAEGGADLVVLPEMFNCPYYNAAFVANAEPADGPSTARLSAAAAQNGVLFYPILVKQEAKSWRRLVQEAFPRFLEGSYEGAYEAKLKQEFLENLS